MCAKISKELEGKMIKKIYVYQEGSELHKEVDIDDSKELLVYSGDGTIIIEFEDGTNLACWNSEWGGIEIIDKSGGKYLELK